MLRVIKQLVYGAFYLSIVTAIGYVIFFRFFFPPSCADGIKNQGETGIDCGGPCPSCEIRALSDPRVEETVFFVNTAERTIDLASRVRNPNAFWGIKRFDYEFVLRRADGKEIDRVKGSDFLMPGELRWIVRPGGGTEFPSIPLPQDDYIAKVDFVLKPIAVNEWQKVKSFAGEASIRTKNLKFALLRPPQVGFAELQGEVENRSSFFLDQVEVNGVIYDKTGRVIAVGKTLVRTLRPGEARFFSIKWSRQFSGEVARYEASGHSNFLLDLNFLQRFAD